MTRAGRHYADHTPVPVARSKAEIDTLLVKAGAKQRAIVEAEDRALILFSMVGRQFRLEVPLPTEADKPAQREREQLIRSRWRCMLLLLKAKFAQIQLGSSTVEREFLADLVLPQGDTLHQTIAERVETAYLSGTMPTTLLLPR